MSIQYSCPRCGQGKDLLHYPYSQMTYCRICHYEGPAEEFDIRKNTVGRKYDYGKPMWDLLPLDALEQVVNVLTYGAGKYSKDNWKRVDPERYRNALWRHWVAFKKGETNDPETGLHHLAHMITNVLFLLYFESNKEEK